MKAKAWVEKYNHEQPEEFLKAYAEETSKLIKERTAGSGVFTRNKISVNTKPLVVDGVLREQRQKWVAICNLLTAFTPDMFDKAIMAFYLPDVVVEQQKWREKKNKVSTEEVKPEEATAEDVEAGHVGRTLVK